LAQLWTLNGIVVGQEILKQVGKRLLLLNQVINPMKIFPEASLFKLDTNSKSKTLAEIDGDDSILYWVDLTTEMAFYLPHQFSG
jgi:hypothetical protein